MTTDEAACYLNLSPQTLATWRCRGLGPAYISMKNKGTVRYYPKDLDQWLAERRVIPEPTPTVLEAGP